MLHTQNVAHNGYLIVYLVEFFLGALWGFLLDHLLHLIKLLECLNVAISVLQFDAILKHDSDSLLHLLYLV